MTNKEKDLWLQWVNAAMQVDPGNAVVSANDALKQYKRLQGLSDQEVTLQRLGDRVLNEIDGMFLDLYNSPIFLERNREAELGILERCRSAVKSVLAQHGCNFPPEEA